MRAAGFEPNVVRRYCTVLCDDSLYYNDKIVFKVALQEERFVVAHYVLTVYYTILYYIILYYIILYFDSEKWRGGGGIHVSIHYPRFKL